MRLGTIKRICNRKALFGLCIVVMGFGMALILLALLGELTHLLSPNQSAETGAGILFRLLGGVVLVLVGFSGLVWGNADADENTAGWFQGREPGGTSMEICCCSCKALNDVQVRSCGDCGADLSPTKDHLPRNKNGVWLGSRFCKPPKLTTSGGSLRSTPATHREDASDHTDLGIGVRNRFSIHGLHALNVWGQSDKIIKISPKTVRAGLKTSR